MTSNDTQLLKIEQLCVQYPVLRGILQRQVSSVRAVQDVSFVVEKGTTLGLVGESGSGKSTLAYAILGLVKISSGRILVEGSDLRKLSPSSLRRARRDVQMIFQDVSGALNPGMRVDEIIAEPLVIHKIYKSSADRSKFVNELLDLVGLPQETLLRKPSELSGGQRQRVGIARALALRPKLLVCDEATGSLDVSIQAQILNLLRDLQQELDLTYIFISHNISTVNYVADFVAVMYLDSLMEWAPAGELFRNPQHPYTQALLASVPKNRNAPGIQREGMMLLEGEALDTARPLTGCCFSNRCAMRADECVTDVPEWRDTGEGHWAACHFVS